MLELLNAGDRGPDFTSLRVRRENRGCAYDANGKPVFGNAHGVSFRIAQRRHGDRVETSVQDVVINRAQIVDLYTALGEWLVANPAPAPAAPDYKMISGKL